MCISAAERFKVIILIPRFIVVLIIIFSFINIQRLFLLHGSAFHENLINYRKSNKDFCGFIGIIRLLNISHLIKIVKILFVINQYKRIKTMFYYVCKQKTKYDFKITITGLKTSKSREYIIVCTIASLCLK